MSSDEERPKKRKYEVAYSESGNIQREVRNGKKSKKTKVMTIEDPGRTREAQSKINARLRRLGEKVIVYDELLEIHEDDVNLLSVLAIPPTAVLSQRVAFDLSNVTDPGSPEKVKEKIK